MCLYLALILTKLLFENRHTNLSTLFLLSISSKDSHTGGRLKMAPTDGLGSQGWLVGWLAGWLSGSGFEGWLVRYGFLAP